MKRVLVVEDRQESLELIVAALEDNYEMLIARDGEEGIAAARRHHPDLILLDLGLPGMDGWNAAGELKADADLRTIPVVAVTGYAMKGDREKALDAGCDDYISKPFSLAELYEVVGRFLGSAGESRAP